MGAHATPGSVIELPDGEYRNSLNDCLEIGIPLTIRRCATASKRQTVLLGNVKIYSSGVRLEGLSMCHDQANNLAQWVYIDIHGFDGLEPVELNDCHLSIGIWTRNDVDLAVRHCVFDGISRFPALQLGENNRVLVESNKFLNFDEDFSAFS